MSDASVMMSLQGKAARLLVTGRGTFVISQKIRSTGMGLLDIGMGRLLIDLSGCCSLDSSCMGTLAMIALKGKDKGVSVELESLSTKVDEQLTDLGIKYLFSPLASPVPQPAGEQRPVEAPDGADVPTLKETILEAHKTLGKANPENIQRFRGVVEELEKSRDG